VQLLRFQLQQKLSVKSLLKKSPRASSRWVILKV
jgi:hypothetical protein